MGSRRAARGAAGLHLVAVLRPPHRRRSTRFRRPARRRFHARGPDPDPRLDLRGGPRVVRPSFLRPSVVRFSVVPQAAGRPDRDDDVPAAALGDPGRQLGRRLRARHELRDPAASPQPPGGHLHRALPASLLAAPRGQHGAAVHARPVGRLPGRRQVPGHHAHRDRHQRAGRVAIPEWRHADGGGERAGVRVLRLCPGPRAVRPELGRHRGRGGSRSRVQLHPAGGHPGDARRELARSPRRPGRRGARRVAAAG